MRRHSFVWSIVAVIGSVAVGALQAAPIGMPVICNMVQVGTINMDTVGGAAVGGFTSTAGMPPSLAAAAAACSEHHFNWYQIVTADNQAPKDRMGNQLVPPYVDVPPGGYDVAFDPTWADDLPWYYDEYEPPAGTKDFNPGFLRKNKEKGATLEYEDAPGGKKGLMLSFKTWLVSLNANGSFHSFHPGFSWDLTIDAMGKREAKNLMALLNNKTPVLPTNAEYQQLTRGFATAIPEPATFALLAAGLAAMGLFARPRR